MKAPKTAAGIRDVELSPEAIAALDVQKRVSEGIGARMWLNPNTLQPWTTDAQVRKTLWLPTAGQNPWYVAKQLGHEDVEMVFRTYGKFIREDYMKPRAEFRNAE